MLQRKASAHRGLREGRAQAGAERSSGRRSVSTGDDCQRGCFEVWLGPLSVVAVIKSSSRWLMKSRASACVHPDRVSRNRPARTRASLVAARFDYILLVIPASTAMVVPVTNLPSSEAR